MGMIAGIISMVGGIVGMGEQKKAGKLAKEAGEDGARSIMAETEENIRQTKRSQAQTLGIAMSIIASSGIKFDARRIKAVNFSEGGMGSNVITDKQWKAGYLTGNKFTAAETFIGGSTLYEEETKRTEYSASESFGQQISGPLSGSSSFNYLREMKKAFSKDLGWQAKQGAARANIASKGGQIAYAQSQARVAESTASIAKTAYSLKGRGNKTPKTQVKE